MGAMPSVVFSLYGNHGRHSQLASYESHLKPRLKELLSATSRDVNYWTFAFDAYVVILIAIPLKLS